MKKILTLLFAIFVFTTMSFAQKNAFSIQSGYSYSTGLIGAEYQHKKIGIGAGVMPFRNESQVIKPSYSAVITYYGKHWNQDSWYVSGAFASGKYSSDYPDNPMFIFTVGGKQHLWSNLSVKGGFGYVFTQDDAFPAFEVSLRWSFGL